MFSVVIIIVVVDIAFGTYLVRGNSKGIISNENRFRHRNSKRGPFDLEADSIIST